MRKNHFIIIILTAAILILTGVFIWLFYQKDAWLSEPKPEPEPEPVVVEEVYSFTVMVSEVNIEASFLMAEEIKVIVGPETKVFGMMLPEERNEVFVTERKEITIEEIKVGDPVFIKSNTNIVDLKVLDDVNYIEILTLED